MRKFWISAYNLQEPRVILGRLTDEQIREHTRRGRRGEQTYYKCFIPVRLIYTSLADASVDINEIQHGENSRPIQSANSSDGSSGVRKGHVLSRFEEKNKKKNNVTNSFCFK